MVLSTLAFLCVGRRRGHEVHVGLELLILLPPPPECWDCRCVHHSASTPVSEITEIRYNLA